MPDVEIIWRAFELRPDPVPLPDPKGEYLSRIWSQSVLPLAERLGIEMRMPPVKPRSRLAHEAAFWARKQGRFQAMNEAIFRAYFERGEDISRAETLISLASAIGLDGEDLKRSLDKHDYLEEVIADERQAAIYGLSGVPAFVAAGTVLFGVQPLSALEEFARLARNAKDASPGRGSLPHLPIKLER